MGSLTEESFRAANGRTYTTRVGDILEELDDEDRATFLRVLADPDLSHGSVADTMTSSGYPISTNSIRHYRLRVMKWRA